MKKKEKTRSKVYPSPPKLTAEQRLEWLEGMRAFMFEVWKQNPDLLIQYLKRRGTTW